MSEKKQQKATTSSQESSTSSIENPLLHDVGLKTYFKKRKTVSNFVQLDAPSFKDSPFDGLGKEILSNIFQHLSLDELSVLSMASKGFSNAVFREMRSDKFVDRVTHLMSDVEGLSSKKILKKFSGLGRLLKRVSFLHPVQLRLELFHHFTTKMSEAVVNLSPEKMPTDFNKTLCFGSILQTFISGWDETECTKVFVYLNARLLLSQSIIRFVSSEMGEDLVNERFIRQQMRGLFLDNSADDRERAMWIGFIAQQFSTSKLAKVILLLYAPLDSEGKVEWNFAFNVRAFKLYTSEFKQLARIVGSLRLIPNWTAFLSLEVLVYISNIPNCWLLRSFSALLLPLSGMDKELVLDYFCILYNNGRASTASLLLALIMMVSPQFVETRSHGLIIDRTSVHRVIKLVIDSPKLSLERYSAVSQIWDAVMGLAEDFTESAVNNFGEDSDASEDLSDLMEAWADVTANLLIEHC